MNPTQRAGLQATRTALGSDYEARLRQQAGEDRTQRGHGWAYFCQMMSFTRTDSNSRASCCAEPPHVSSSCAAGPDPGKMAKRKHQIGSIFHHAKAQELERLEKACLDLKLVE